MTMPSSTPAWVEQLQECGYAVRKGLLDPQRDLAPLHAEYATLLDGLARQWHATGRLRSAYEDLALEKRFAAVFSEMDPSCMQYFDISLPKFQVTEETPLHLGPAVFNLMRHPRLLDTIETFIGGEIYSNPVQHIRMKLPQRAVAKSAPYTSLVSYTPWHQDNGVILPEADESRILTVWFSLTESTVENGCMQVFPRSHRGDLVTHCPVDKGLTIADSLLPAITPTLLPMHPGSVLLMTSRTIHSSLENTTEDEVRVSFDIRYQPTGQPTGRPAFPGFVAHSSAAPQSVLSDPAAWEASWLNARAALAEQSNPTFNRWKSGVGACA